MFDGGAASPPPVPLEPPTPGWAAAPRPVPWLPGGFGESGDTAGGDAEGRQVSAGWLPAGVVVHTRAAYLNTVYTFI